MAKRRRLTLQQCKYLDNIIVRVGKLGEGAKRRTEAEELPTFTAETTPLPSMKKPPPDCAGRGLKLKRIAKKRGTSH